MMKVQTMSRRVAALCLSGIILGLAACSQYGTLPAALPAKEEGPGPWFYTLGPGDTVSIFVWRNPEVSSAATVRPDGRITVPLIEDLPVTGKTPTQLARDIEKELSLYIQDPLVTVISAGGVGPFAQQIRIVGEAVTPGAIPYTTNMTLLDAMIASGGLSEFAAGNRARIFRVVGGKRQVYRVRIDDLLKEADMEANVRMAPGDILIIPEAWF